MPLFCLALCHKHWRKPSSLPWTKWKTATLGDTDLPHFQKFPSAPVAQSNAQIGHSGQPKMVLESRRLKRLHAPQGSQTVQEFQVSPNQRMTIGTPLRITGVWPHTCQDHQLGCSGISSTPRKGSGPWAVWASDCDTNPFSVFSTLGNGEDPLGIHFSWKIREWILNGFYVNIFSSLKPEAEEGWS